MSFVSLGFLAFLAVLILLYYLVPKKGQWILLLAGSVFFYAFAGWSALIFIAVTALSTYLAGIYIGKLAADRDKYIKEHSAELDKEAKKAYKAKVKKRTYLIMSLCLLLNLGMLAVIKYTDFGISIVNGIFRTNIGFVHFALPMGISFYIFQSMGYIIDVYRGKYAPEKNIARFALFVSFFPQLLQGPISRFDELSKTLYGPHKFDWNKFARGAWRVLWGYFKKVVIADRMITAVLALSGEPEKYTGVYVVALVLFYAIELYADFTGGIDITIGVAEMLGIEVAENFDRPFFSLNITEYWRRWHITMGTWFKDYIFYPLSVSPKMLKISKWSREKLGQAIGKRVPVYLSTIIVWFATGLWHGAAWNFIVWGLLNCLVIIVSQELSPLYTRFHKRFGFSNTKGYNVFQMFRTFWLMGFIRVLDVYRDVPGTFRQVWSVFTTANWGNLFSGSFLKLGLTLSDFIAVLAGCAVMFTVSVLQNKGQVRDNIILKRPVAVRLVVFVLIALLITIFGAYGIGYDAGAFIYGQF
ncbi:MAG: MBOAT family protein [Clostridia bacterium]|nr:MBOAT family protein [Clostridia bacterium]